MLSTNTTLAELAVKHPSASRVFHRYGLDFCCHGNRSIDEACLERGLTTTSIVAEIEAEQLDRSNILRWDERPLSELIDHIVKFYHQRLREGLPQLVEMASRVEKVHASKPSCPVGLASHLRSIHLSVIDHLAKEETILFPMILAGRGRMARPPIHVMEIEHGDHAENLRRTRLLTGNLNPPPEACSTWSALYLRLDDFEAELMEHIHLENNVLFRRALMESI